jgi:uncharacterized protein YajQ (UPF0234 family)
VTFHFTREFSPHSRHDADMPSFDIVSEVDLQEVDNALNQARKEITTRFDFKHANAEIEQEKDKIILRSGDGMKAAALTEIVLAKLAKRNVPLQNIDRGEVEISSMGHARQELKLKQGIEHEVGKKVTAAVRDTKLKLTCQIQDQKIRVQGKNRDDLQAAMTAVRAGDFGVSLSFENFRD